MTEVVLRELCVDDIPVINRWRNDQDLLTDLVAPFRFINIETDRQWFDHYMRNRDSMIRCAICLRKDPAAIIGSIGLINIDYINRKADFYLQIGEAAHRGKGVGREATVQMLRHAFDNVNLHRVQLVVLATNRRAIGLYEKVGFSTEGTMRRAVYKRGAMVDLVMMAIFKDEFNGSGRKTPDGGRPT